MLIIVGVLCFIIPSVIWGIFILAFRLRSRVTTGTIVDYHGHEESSQAPVVEFELPDGQKVTFTEPTQISDSILTMLPDLFNLFVLKKDPNQVIVIYDPNNPQKARVNTFTYLYSIPLTLFVIGFCIFLYAIPFFHDLLTPLWDFLIRLAHNL